MKILKISQILFFWFVLASCSSVPDFGLPGVELFDNESENITIRLEVDTNLNPDNKGRPSPLVFRVYQMTADAQFRSLDFNTLYEQKASVLGADLRKLDETLILPGTSISYNLKVFKDTQFIGILAAYQNETASKPKLVFPYDGDEAKDLCIKVGSLKLELVIDC